MYKLFFLEYDVVTRALCVQTVLDSVLYNTHMVVYMETNEMRLILAEDLLAGADEAAKFTGLSRRTIYHLVEQNQIPFCRMGSRLYFRKSTLSKSFSGPSSPEQFFHHNRNDESRNPI